MRRGSTVGNRILDGRYLNRTGETMVIQWKRRERNGYMHAELRLGGSLHNLRLKAIVSPEPSGTFLS